MTPRFPDNRTGISGWLRRAAVDDDTLQQGLAEALAEQEAAEPLARKGHEAVRQREETP